MARTAWIATAFGDVRAQRSQANPRLGGREIRIVIVVALIVDEPPWHGVLLEDDLRDLDELRLVADRFAETPASLRTEDRVVKLRAARRELDQRGPKEPLVARVRVLRIAESVDGVLRPPERDLDERPMDVFDDRGQVALADLERVADLQRDDRWPSESLATRLSARSALSRVRSMLAALPYSRRTA